MRTNIDIDLKNIELPMGVYIEQEDSFAEGIVLPLYLVPRAALERLVAQFRLDILEKAGYTMVQEGEE